jgi:hypothetical protein
MTARGGVPTPAELWNMTTRGGVPTPSELRNMEPRGVRTTYPLGIEERGHLPSLAKERNPESDAVNVLSPRGQNIFTRQLGLFFFSPFFNTFLMESMTAF